MTVFTIRRLLPADAADYRELRLEALRDHPEAFTAAFEEERERPVEWTAARLEEGFVLGGRADGGLLGCAGFFVRHGPKLSHKGVLWGMYVRPAGRGSGLSRALIAAIIDHARGKVDELTLSVATENVAALGAYRAMGFEDCGYEARLMRVGGRDIDEVTLAVRFTS